MKYLTYMGQPFKNLDGEEYILSWDGKTLTCIYKGGKTSVAHGHGPLQVETNMAGPWTEATQEQVDLFVGKLEKGKITQYLNQLPDGYRELALANYKKYGDETNPLFNREQNIANAISSGFSWKNTLEGYDFWESVCFHYRHGCPLPPLPSERKTTINIEELSRLPDGQYVLTWNYNGAPWSHTIKVKGGELYYYNNDSDSWETWDHLDSTKFTIYPPVELKTNPIPQEKLDALNILFENYEIEKCKGKTWISIKGDRFRVPSLDEYDFEESA